MKGFMESFNHPFGKEACKKRLFPNSKKPYYNILLDDRAGLEESYEILKYVVDEIIKLN